MIKMWMEKVCITYYNKKVFTCEQLSWESIK